MQQGRTAGKTFIPKQFTDYFTCPHTKQREVAKALARAGACTVKQLCDLSSCTATTVRTTLIEMKRRRFVYISGWYTTSQSNRAPIFSVGDQPDVERPRPKHAATRAEQNRRTAEHDPVADALSLHCRSLATALVPRRTAQAQHHVNWQYLAWLFHQSSGALRGA
jgi:hypothetical protein